MATSQIPQKEVGEFRLFAQTSFPEAYEQELVGPLFRPWVDELLDDVELRPGDNVLDIACGTGIVARVAKDRLMGMGRVVGVDVNPQMIAVARRLAPAIDWREGNAGGLPLAQGEEFDVLVCQQGFQFFPDRAAAVQEMRRALAPGGRVGISAWRSDDEFPVLRRLREITEQHVGPIHDRRHGLGDPAPIESVLREAGFRDVRSRRVSRTIRFADGAVFVRLNAMAMVSMSAASGAMDEEARVNAVAAISRDSAELIAANTDAAGFAYEIGTNVVLARG